MKKPVLAISMIVMLGACGDPEPREVNDENCEPEAILQWAEENNLSRKQMQEFRRKCLYRGPFERSEEKVWKFGKD